MRLFQRIRPVFLLFAVAAVPVAMAPVAARAEVPSVRKVAMVDMQRVLNETKAGKRARNELEASSKSKQEKLDKKKSKLEADFAKLKNMQGQELQAAQERLQQESMELQSMLMALQNELAQQEGKLLEKMYRNSQGIVAKLAGEKGLDLVLVRDDMTVIYAKNGLDITDDVIKRYNKAHPK